MNDEIKTKIIMLYNSGIGSTAIEKQLNIPKKQILKILNDENLIINRKHKPEDFKDVWFENDKWWGYWICKQCNKKILAYAQTPILILRNLKQKTICKNCSLQNQIGVGNPFYGKTHTNQTKNKISKTKKGICTSDHMKTPEYKELFSQMGKKRWENNNMEWLRKKMSDGMKKRIDSGDFKGYNRSKAENELINLLLSKNIKCIPNFKIETKIFDLYIPDYNLIIEYNGDYWHCNPKKI